MTAMKFFLAVLASCIALDARSYAGQDTKPEAILIVSASDSVLAPLALAGAGRHRPVLLFDPRASALVEHYPDRSQRGVQCLRRSETPPEVAKRMEEIAGAPCELADDPLALAARLWPGATAAVVVSTQDESWLLHAAAFGGATESAVLAVDPTAAPPLEQLRPLGLATLYLTPPFAGWKTAVSPLAPNIVEIGSAADFSAELLRRLPAPPDTVVIANPGDRRNRFLPASLSLLAPLVSAAHQAPLFLTERRDAGEIEAEVLAFLDHTGLKPTHLVLVGDELALGNHRVPDPVLHAGGPEARGGGTDVRVELFSEIQNGAPQDFAVGRIIAESAAIGSGILARQLHTKKTNAGRPAHFLINADSVFELGEVISRTTVQELKNLSVPVRAHYRTDVTTERIRKSLAATGLLVWEGHPRDLTLKESGGISAEHVPDYVILQGCYTLDRSDPFILIERGTLAIVATSAAIYSASGSAFTRALFNALLYEGADLGTAVRDARNYLLALARLQRERGHKDWRKTLRSALAFTLWGDPTLRPPLQPAPPVRVPLRWALADSALTLEIPERTLPEAAVGRYRANPVPGAMLGGLLLIEGGVRRTKDLFFTTMRVGAETKAVCAREVGWNGVSLYAPRTGTLSFLARADWDFVRAPKRSGTFFFPLAQDPNACIAPAQGPPPREAQNPSR